MVLFKKKTNQIICYHEAEINEAVILNHTVIYWEIRVFEYSFLAQQNAAEAADRQKYLKNFFHLFFFSIFYDFKTKFILNKSVI